VAYADMYSSAGKCKTLRGWLPWSFGLILIQDNVIWLGNPPNHCKHILTHSRRLLGAVKNLAVQFIWLLSVCDIYTFTAVLLYYIYISANQIGLHCLHCCLYAPRRSVNRAVVDIRLCCRCCPLVSHLEYAPYWRRLCLDDYGQT